MCSPPFMLAIDYIHCIIQDFPKFPGLISLPVATQSLLLFPQMSRKVEPACAGKSFMGWAESSLFFGKKKQCNILWLVVDLPIWKIWVRQLGWWHFQYMESHKIHVPNHQPAWFPMELQYMISLWFSYDFLWQILVAPPHLLLSFSRPSTGTMWTTQTHQIEILISMHFKYSPNILVITWLIYC